MNKEQSDIKNFTRGGQITLHNIRMLFQIMDKVCWVVTIILVVLSAFLIFISVTSYEWYVLGEYFWSYAMLIFNPDRITQFILPNGSTQTITYASLKDILFIQHIVKTITLKWLRSTIFSLIIAIVSFIIISRWLKNRGEKQTEDEFLKGDKILSTPQTKKIIIQKNENSDLSLAGLPLIKDSETAHIFFHGTTGSGKSNAIKELLDQIRLRGDRAIIYDKSCNYLEEFFDPRRDYLLNPLDERGMPWDLWQECRDAADFDSLAAAQIPMPLSTQDPFWVNAARTIFSAVACQMQGDQDRSISKLLNTLLSADLAETTRYLKGTGAETLISDKIEKTAVSIKSVLATYLKSLQYVKTSEKAFSIRKWIQDEKEKQWLFITSLGDRHETLKPLISSWIDIAVNALLSLTPNPKRRIWLILDELTSLQPLPYLTQTLSESRKFGGCVVIGIQNYAQLAKLYGIDGAREISSLLSTRFMFRQPDPEMARWSAINFGEFIVNEVREGISYGANTMRDGISINRIEAKKALVSYSEIMSLANLAAFVRLPGDIPITRVNFTYKVRKPINIGLLESVAAPKNTEKPEKEDETILNQANSNQPVDSNSEEEKNVKSKKDKKNKKINERPITKTEQALDI